MNKKLPRPGKTRPLKNHSKSFVATSKQRPKEETRSLVYAVIKEVSGRTGFNDGNPLSSIPVDDPDDVGQRLQIRMPYRADKPYTNGDFDGDTLVADVTNYSYHRD